MATSIETHVLNAALSGHSLAPFFKEKQRLEIARECCSGPDGSRC